MANVDMRRQAGLLVTTLAMGLLVGGCGTFSSQSTKNDVRHENQRPSSQRPARAHSWDTARVLRFAGTRLQLGIQGRPKGASFIDEHTALKAARRFSDPHGTLAGTALAVVSANGRFEHRPMWLAVYHVREPRYSDVMVQPPGAPSPIISENPMVDALMTFVVDAETGEVQFAATR